MRLLTAVILAFDKDDIPTSPILSDDEDERPDFVKLDWMLLR